MVSFRLFRACLGASGQYYDHEEEIPAESVAHHLLRLGLNIVW